MKRRRRSLAAGLVVALVGFGDPANASSDSFGKKIPPPPPLSRPNLSDRRFQEHGEGSEPQRRSTADVSTNIIPPPPPRQQLNGIPPPRIPPPPQRTSQTIQALDTHDQHRVPPPPRPDKYNVKDDDSENIISYMSKMTAKDETKSIEEVQHSPKIESNMKPQGIAQLQHLVPPPPPLRPGESKAKDKARVSDTGNASERPVHDEGHSIEQVQQPQELKANLNPGDMEQHQRTVPPPPPPRPEESNIKDDDHYNTSEKDGIKPIEQLQQPLRSVSNMKQAAASELHQRVVPPPPPPRPDEHSVKDSGYTNYIVDAAEKSPEEKAESIEPLWRLQEIESSLKPNGYELHQHQSRIHPPPRPEESNTKHSDFSNTFDDASSWQSKDETESTEEVKETQAIEFDEKPLDMDRHRWQLPPPPPRRSEESNIGYGVGSASEQRIEEDESENTESEEEEIELHQRRFSPPLPGSMGWGVSHEDFGIASGRTAAEEVSGSREPMQEPHSILSYVKPEDDVDVELNTSAEPAEAVMDQGGKMEPDEALQKSEEVSAESEIRELQLQNSESMNPRKHVANSIQSSESDKQTETWQSNERPQAKEEPTIDLPKSSPFVSSGPNSNAQTAFVRNQSLAQRSGPQTEISESRLHPQQQTFTMPLTQQNPMQPNLYQQQSQQQGNYRQAPNPQHQYGSRLPPTNMRRQPPRTTKPTSTTTSLFKSIMGTVEKGLDELSNMEDKIARRAQDLVSNAASSSGVSSVVQVAKRKLSSRSSSSRRPPSRASPPTSSSDASPFSHLGKKYESAKSGNEASSSPPGVKQLIRANGGASAPGGQTPTPPIPPKPYPEGDSATPGQSQQPQQGQQQGQQPPKPLWQQQQSQQQQYSQTPSQGTGQGSIPGTQSPYGANLYKPATEAPKTSDPHSRESRIPWEISKTGTNRPSQSQTPAMKTFEEDDVSWKEKLMGALPRFPRLPNPAKLFRFRKSESYQYASMDAWEDDDDDASRRGFFGFFKKKSSSGLSQSTIPQVRPSTGNTESAKTPIDSLMARSKDAKTTTLLVKSDTARCQSLGRYHAAFDFVQVMFLILGVQQLSGLEMLTIPTSLLDVVSTTIPMVIEIIRTAMTSWAPFWFAYALLTEMSRRLMLESKVEGLAAEVAASVEDDAEYGQLYLRLIASTPMDTRLLSRLGEAAQHEVRWKIAKARLNSFATLVAGLLIFMTATVLRPAISVIGKTAFDLATLQELRSWPVAWRPLWSHSTAIMASSFQKLQNLFVDVLLKALEKPLDVAFRVSIFAALLLATMIPKVESKKTVPTVDDEEEEIEVANDSLDQLSRLGASSATRLTMLSENGSVENVLERWRALNVPAAVLQPSVRLSQVLRQMSYVVLAGLTVFAPLLIPFPFQQVSSSSGLHTGLQWDSMLDVSVILMSVFLLVWNALKQSTVLRASLPYVKSFLSDLSKTMEEIAASNKQQADLTLSASISANAGLAVRDLWAAHTSKRAWAVRGATLECRNGEVLAVLGDDSSGKTRLLTTIAEALITPPKRSRTSNKVRGHVVVGGLDSSKWDKPSLKRRLGILLSDVCTLGDTACIFSGWTLEEILEPVDGVQSYPRALTSSEKSAMLLGLKITGLYDTVVRRLPSKMNTVITGNEEDLGKPTVDPSTTVLSPAEWSKLLLAKVIAQTISDNDNVLASTDKIENSLMGSVLILDDVAVLLSEVEEAKIIRDLRKTGAATVITSNKWATGRFADKIAVVKDGAIVEVGSHNELIARGPQRSLYAAKWHAMTMG